MNNPHAFPILSDHLATPRKVLDENSGEVRWTWDAKQPFGHELPNENPTAGLESFVFDLRFPGQRYDEETGLFQNGFRDYHPGLGRYVQSDPIGLDGSWNTYSYVSGNPMNNSDAMGLKIDPKAWENIYFVEAIVYLSQSAEGRKIIDEVESAFATVEISIKNNGESNFRADFYLWIPSALIRKGYVEWDPGMGINDISDSSMCKVGLSPAMNLVHEFIHFLQAKQLGGEKYDREFNEKWDKIPGISKEFYSTLENNAVKREKKVASELGEMERNKYNDQNNKKFKFPSVDSKRPVSIK